MKKRQHLKSCSVLSLDPAGGGVLVRNCSNESLLQIKNFAHQEVLWEQKGRTADGLNCGHPCVDNE